MGDESDETSTELYCQHGVVVKSIVNHSPGQNITRHDEYVHSLGVLSIVDHKTGPGKCIEWTQCDVSIESDDQEWAIVGDSKCNQGIANGNSKNSKAAAIQIPLKQLLRFKVWPKNPQLTFYQEGGSESTFYFQHGQVKSFVDTLKTMLNTSVTKRDLNSYIVRDQKEVQILEKSFAELDLFSDDNTRSDAVWSFIKQLQENPYETTLNAFSKVTDVFLYKPVQFREIDTATDILSGSFASDELSDFHSRSSPGDYELITKAPPLPPRTLPLRSSQLNLEKWTLFFDDAGRITNTNDVKELIFHGGVSPEGGLRSEVWKFLLGYYPWDSTFDERVEIKRQKKEEYFTMKLQWKTMTAVQENNFAGYKERKSLIEKDVCRTDRNMPFFAGDNNSNLETLQDILMTYIMYNFDLGYVQGMSDLLSPLLLHIRDEVDTFWCFVGFMNKVYHNFDMDQAGMKKQLHQLYCLLCFIEPDLANCLKQQEANNMYFCFRWLLIWFKREFSCSDICILWEALWTDAICKNFHLLICAAILDTEKETIMSNNYGFTEILKHVNDLANKINLDMVLRKAEGIYVQLSAAAVVPPAVSEMFGLPSRPETAPARAESESSTGETSSKTQNGIYDQCSPYINIESNELAFDNSISLQYL